MVRLAAELFCACSHHHCPRAGVQQQPSSLNHLQMSHEYMAGREKEGR